VDREVRRRLRTAVYRGDADEIMAVLTAGIVRDFPQICGEALLVALAGHVSRAEPLAGECVAALVARDWDGDAELAADLQRALGQSVTTPELTPVPVEVEQLVDLLRGGEHHVGGRVNVRTGEAWPELSYVDARDAGLLDDDEDENDASAEDVWLQVDALGARAGYRDMERFIADRVPPAIAPALTDAISGKGAFARFRARIAQSELEDSWHRYSEERWSGRARSWLADAGYRPVPIPRPS
jgi:hypothetical protein